MNAHPHAVQRGFTLIEALVALLIVAFGLMALAGVNLKLAQSEDVAKQRGEAVRLAQERIEALRSFTRIDAAAGQLAWDDLASGTDTIAESANYHTNTTFTRTWVVSGAAADPMRTVRVTVAWNDRANDPQSVTLASVLSKSDPSDVGSLGFPLPANTTLKQPKNRNLNIPVPAVDLGNGQSVVQLQNNFAVVFSNESGYVVKTCAFVVVTAADLAGCSTANAYIIAGYVSLSGTASFPAGLGVNTAQLTGTTGVTCSFSDARDQTTNAVIAGYKYYLCVVSVPAAGDPWAGTMRLSGAGLNAGTNYLVCRFQYPTTYAGNANQRNVQPYAGVAESLDNQNFVVTTASSCPTIQTLATVQHQNCRSSNPNSNAANRANDCPAV